MDTMQEEYYDDYGYGKFREFMTMLAVEDGDYCAQLLTEANLRSKEHGYRNPLFRLNERCKPYPKRMSKPAPIGGLLWKDLLALYEGGGTEEKSIDTEKEQKKQFRNEEEAIDEFVRLCVMAQRPDGKRVEHLLESFLSDLYRSDLAYHILFLLKHSSKDVIRQFAQSHLGTDLAAQMATVDIVVRKNDNLRRMTGNTGRYLIFTRKGENDEEQLLKFTNQASTVYYLMFLISRCQTDRLLPFVELQHNKDMFLELYRQVYDEHETTLDYKYKTLLKRTDQYNQVRAGRLHEIVLDIRRHLEERFGEYGEDYEPYAMTAHQHLTVSPERIHFEGEARQLLLLDFV